MAGRRYLLDLENTLYEIQGNRLGIVTGVRGLSGEKMIFSDFDGASPQVATVEATPAFASAVLEKQLRENGEIESGGRVIILDQRRKNAHVAEVLYVATPGKPLIEQELEREGDDTVCLLFPVHKILSKTLDARRPAEPEAILLLHDRHVDVVVGDRRNLYGAFRVSAYRAGSDHERLGANLEQALAAVERDNNICVTRIHCQHLLVEDRDADAWIDSLARSRGIACKRMRAQQVLVDGRPAWSSTLKLLRGLGPAESCSPPDVVTDFRVNRLLPVAATVLLLCCVAALAALVDREYRSLAVAAETTQLGQSIRQRIDHDAPPVPEYRPALETALALDHARRIPSLGAVLSRVSGAATDKATRLDEIVVDYDEERVQVDLRGSTEKSSGTDSMAFYSRFVAALRGSGYALADSSLDTDTQRIRFRLRLVKSLEEQRT